MPIRVSNIRLGIDESEQALPQHAARALGIRATDIQRWRILRKSLDARDKADLRFVYSAEVVVAADESSLVVRVARARQGVTAELFSEPTFTLPPPGETALAERPVVVGSGPAGLVAAYFLATAGYRPLVIERGQPVCGTHARRAGLRRRRHLRSGK